MPRRCFVPFCKSGYDSNSEKVSIFSVPKNKVEIWNRLIPRQDRDLTAKDYVCEKHFDEQFIVREIKTDCYTIKLGRPRLSEDAVPSIFPNCPKYLTKNITNKRRVLVKLNNPHPAKRKKVATETAEETSDDFGESVVLSSNVFNKLWTNCNSNVFELPSKSWSFHFIPKTEKIFNENDIIVITQMMGVRGNVFTTKKIILTEDSVIFNIFEKNLPLEKFMESDFDYLKCTVAEFENLILSFDKLSVCLGSEFDDDFSGKRFKFYHKDGVLNNWRHNRCEYFVTDGLSNICQFCKRVNKGIKSFRHRQKNKPVILRDTLKKRLERNRKQKIRLLKKNSKILKELSDARVKIRKQASAKNILESINKLQLPSTQKMLIKECIKMCRYRKKS